MKFRLFIGFLLISGFIHAQTQLYVSPAGNDGNPGTLILPFQTIQYAVNNAPPGTTIYLMGGTYYEEVSVNTLATAANPIVLTNYNNQNAVISRPVSDSCCPLLHINNATYFTVSGIEFSHYASNNASAIHVEGLCDHVEVSNNTIHDIHFSSNANATVDSLTKSWPILVDCSHAPVPATNITISGNEIYNCRTGNSAAITVTGNVDGFILSDNQVHDISNTGIYVAGHEGVCNVALFDVSRNGILLRNKIWNCTTPNGYGSAIFANGSRNCTIENNTCFANGYGIEVGCVSQPDSAYGFIIRNNLVYLNQKAGIMIGVFGMQSNFGKVTGCTINNNTLVSNTAGPPFLSEIVLFNSENINVSSNIVYADHFQDVMIYAPAAVNPSFDYNLYYTIYNPNFLLGSNAYTSLSAWSAASGGENHSLFTDPLFVNTAGQNYHLLSTSPAIDHGDSLYVASQGETDMDTMNRIQNGRIDIGADEYGTAVGISVVNANEEQFILYDRSSGQLTLTLSKPATKNGLVNIYSSDGRKVLSAAISAGTKTTILNVSELASGTYIVQANVVESKGVKFVK